MNKDEVIAALCGLVSTVGRRVYKSKLEHDCICHMGYPHAVQVHPEVIAFITSAVLDKISKEAKVKPGNLFPEVIDG
jgi:hypothetical protein